MKAKETSHWALPATYVPRPVLEEQVVSAANARRRLMLSGRVGSGRMTLAYCALAAAGYEVHVVDLLGVVTAADLNRAFRQLGGTEPMPLALRTLNEAARKRPVALVVSNLDGCRGMDDEDAIVGSLRSQLQMARDLAVFYTVSDEPFIGRHVGSSSGALFKQCTILDVGPLDFEEASALWQKRGTPVSETALAVLGDSIGMFAADHVAFASRMEGLRSAAGHPGGTPCDETEMRTELYRLVNENKARYEAWAHSFLTGRQLALLAAVARGLPLRASKEMSAATGIPVRALGTNMKAVQKSGCMVRRGDGWAFADPCFRLHLMARVP